MLLNELLPEAGRELPFNVRLFCATLFSECMGKHVMTGHGLRRDLKRLAQVAFRFQKVRVFQLNFGQLVKYECTKRCRSRRPL